MIFPFLSKNRLDTVRAGLAACTKIFENFSSQIPQNISEPTGPAPESYENQYVQTSSTQQRGKSILKKSDQLAVFVAGPADRLRASLPCALAHSAGR